MNRAILLVSISAAIVGISYGLHSPIVPIFAKQELQADYSTVGIIGMVNFLPYIFAPFFVGMVLDRVNKSYMLAAGISLNIFSIFMLSAAQTIPEVMVLRALAGISHAFFWPSSEVLIATNSTPETRVKGIATFTAAWVGGFMIGPLFGKLILDVFDYRVLFQLASVTIAAALVPALLSRNYGKPIVAEKIEESHSLSMLRVIREVKARPAVSSVLIYYAVTFGIVLSIYPAYMRDSSLTDQTIEILFFVFGVSRFATLYFVQKISGYGTLALAIGVSLTAVAMLISFLFSSVLWFATALVLMGFATSIFYPVTLNIVTSNVPREKMGTRLGSYETIFGAGWAAGPIAVGLSSDAFGPSSPYLAFFIIGVILSGAIVLKKRS